MFKKIYLTVLAQILVLGGFVLFAASSGTDGAVVANSVAETAQSMAGWTNIGTYSSSESCKSACINKGYTVAWEFLYGKCYCQ